MISSSDVMFASDGATQPEPLGRDRFIRHFWENFEKSGSEDERCALVAIKPRRLADINGSFGYAAGDNLLKQVGIRLGKMIEPRTRLCTLGSNLFMVLIPRVMGQPHLELLLNTLLDSLERPYKYLDHPIQMQFRCTAAMFSTALNDVEELLYASESKLNAPLQFGQRYGIFDYSPSGEESIMIRTLLWDDFERGIADDEFSVFYQPQVDLNTGKPVGVEALLRWRHAKHGLVSPHIYIPLAEQLGFIQPLTRWIINAVLRELTKGPPAADSLRVSVNFPPTLLGDNETFTTVTDALDIWGFDPARFNVEITETAMMDDPEAVVAAIHLLRNSGMEVSIDDFGTGFSSLSYLGRLPACELKIDKVFVNGITQREQDRRLCSAIIRLAQEFGMRSVAEGIADAETAAWLKKAECDIGQGFHYAKPMSIKQLFDWLES
jgi:EAL domain-containing protein (putative c-di-GMP-specific phosphodiesterase class I)/GGDEF domain-containing protein